VEIENKMRSGGIGCKDIDLRVIKGIVGFVELVRGSIAGQDTGSFRSRIGMGT